jgi:ribonuclease D
VYKVGLGVRGDARRLYTDFGVHMRSTIDLHDALPSTDAHSSGSLAALAQQHLDVRIDKQLQRSDWSALRLSRALRGDGRMGQCAHPPAHLAETE